MICWVAPSYPLRTATMNATVQSPATTVTSGTPSASSTHPSTFFPELKACKTKRDLKQIHAKFIKTGRIKDPLASAELLRLYALADPPHRDLRYARLVFDQMETPNSFSWNTIIRAHVDGDNEPLKSLVFFIQMLENDEFVKPNQFTFPSVLKACAKTRRLEEGKQTHGFVTKLGLENDGFVLSNLVRLYVMCGAMNEAYRLFDSRNANSQMGDVVLWNVMVDGYVRLGDLDGAQELFDKMPQRSVVSWNSMISGYAQNGFFTESLELFREMQMEDDAMRPNYVTLVSVLPAISRLGALEQGKWMHLYALRNGIRIDAVLGSALIDMYSKCGSIEEALQLFESLPQKNIITWNSIINGLALHGRAHDAVDYFVKMQEAGVSPSEVTYIGVLTACSHAGLVDKGRLIFNQMIQTVGLEAGIEHYGCMVDLLGRAGLLQEAEELVLDMPGKPDDVILKALLGACKKHGNLEIGNRVGKLLMEMNPEDSGSYVALSNIYASSGNWQAVAEMRLLMKEKSIRKDPGCSWIEVDGMIHEFLVEDESHSKAKEIHMMLEEMAEKLNLEGYKPDTTQVLLNMDDMEKESLIHYHSEKIALAFGLISTSPKTTLTIVKNLRICDDCHSLMKLASKTYKRRIIVRDRKRFHHFENGSCSCKDYW